MERVARGARPEPVGQGQLAIDGAADAAGFRGRIEAVRAYDSRPVPFRLVFAKTPEHAPPAVRYALREFAIREHPADVQVFQMYRAVLGDETAGKLVQEVAPLAGHVLVLARDQQTRLVAVGAPLLFAR